MFLSKLICRLRFLLATFIVYSLVSCSGGVNSNVGGSALLTMDQVSTVPLINGQAQTFYVYATNSGTLAMSNIQWSINSQSSLANTSLMQQIKSKLKNLLNKPNQDNQSIVIKDTSECLNIAVGQSCRIQLQANSPGVYQLNAVSGSLKIALLGGAGVVQVNNYIPVNTGNLADMLTITPLSEISYGDGVGSSNFFIINNGESSVQLDIDALKASFPANVSLVLGNCPNPVPGSTACQVRVIITNPTMSTDQELDIPIVLSGEVINDDSSRTVLPKQSGDSNLKATSKSRGIIQYQNLQTVTIDNSYDNVTTASVNGVISNGGKDNLTINSLVPNGDVLSISNDECTGKVLAQGEVCNYIVNLAVNKITNSNSNLITINYLDEAGGLAKSVNSTINWLYTPPLPLANPSIDMKVGSNNLTQLNPTTSITITNDGNVELSNIVMPTMNPSNPRVVINDDPNNSCHHSLAVGATCSFNVTYNPEAPSEITSLTFDKVSASHPDNRGATVTTNFTNSASVNVSSVFEGLIKSTSVVALNEATSSGTITFTNEGNYPATIQTTSFLPNSSSNLVIDNNGCNGKTLSPNTSCDVVVKLNSIVSSGSGNGTLQVTYDNHNGTTNATGSNSNISWLIGAAPSLKVTFASSILVTPITVESTTVVTLNNNGRDDLTNIQIPPLSAPFSYVSGTTDGCAINGSQSLTRGSSCTLILKYNPSSSHSAETMNLGSFSASYDNSGTPATYTTSPYSITVTALSLGNLSINPADVIQSVDWVNNDTQTTTVTIKNVGEIAVTLGTITSNQNEITSTGCGGTLQPEVSCTLNVVGNYTPSASNKTVNGVLTIPYTDAGGIHSKTLDVKGNYKAMPVVTPELDVIANSLFGQNISLGVNQTKSYTVTLTNKTISSNNGAKDIDVLINDLKPQSANGVTYSINTTDIADKPCNLDSNTMTLSDGATCNYNLVIHASSELSDTIINWNIDYKYHNYSINSLTPDLVSATTVNKSFNLAVVSEAQLKVEASDGQANNFNAIERGLTPYPTLGLIITNTGAGGVNGSVTATLPNGITGDFSSCNNLPAGGECRPTLSMSTDNIINAANLDAIDLHYNNGKTASTADFPSIPYSVVAVSSPAISMVGSVIGCASGNGISNSCMNNPNTNGGSASQMKVRLTFTNTSSSVAATNVSLPVTESSLFTTQGYILGSNTCNNGVAANNGTCVIEYSMPSSAGSSAINPNVTSANFKFNYNYTSGQGQNLNGSGSSNLNININIVNPVLTMSAINAIKQAESGAVTITASNFYQSSVPPVTLGVENPTGGSAVGVMTTAITCGDLVSNGAICKGSIVVGDSTPALTGYKAKAIASSISTQSNEVLFDVSAKSSSYSVAYITDFDSNKVTKCTISGNGSLINCNYDAIGADILGGPSGIVISGSYVYIVNLNGKVTKCNYGADNNLINCVNTDVGSDSPYGIAINQNKTIAYIIGRNDNFIRKCNIDGSGNLNSCTNTAQGYIAYDSYAIVLNSSGTIAYIANDQDNAIIKCNVAGDGNISNCSYNVLGSLSNPRSIALNSSGNLAYVANYGNSTISKCTISGDGSFSSCSSDKSIAVNPTGITLNANGDLAYVVDQGMYSTSKCNIDLGSGNLSNCTPAETFTGNPYGIALK